MRRATALPGVQLGGLFTHFSSADSADPEYVHRQLDVFRQAADTVENTGIYVPMLHAANSAAAMRYPEAHPDAVRIGIGMYGLGRQSPASQAAPATNTGGLSRHLNTLPCSWKNND